MRRSSRDRLLISLLGLSTVGVGCSRLTSIDWGLVPVASGGTSSRPIGAGGAAAGEEMGGAPDITPSAGASGEASGGAGGAGGQAGESGNVSGGTAGVSGGGNGGGNGGNGGGNGGNSGGNGGVSGSGGTAGTGGGNTEPTLCSGTTGPLTGAMVLFAGPIKPTAARGGRAGLDADCEAERVKLGLAQTKTHAFITVDGTDYMAIWGTPALFPDLPVAQRIVGPTGIQLAPSWSLLIQGTYIEQSLICAKVLPSGTSFWWLSGNNYVGMTPPNTTTTIYGQWAGAGDTCNGWTSAIASPTVYARPGAAEFAGQLLLAAADDNSKGTTLVPCDSTGFAPILCLAYTP